MATLTDEPDQGILLTQLHGRKWLKLGSLIDFVGKRKTLFGDESIKRKFWLFLAL